jgi:hypothetical protein
MLPTCLDITCGHTEFIDLELVIADDGPLLMTWPSAEVRGRTGDSEQQS